MSAGTQLRNPHAGHTLLAALAEPQPSPTLARAEAPSLSAAFQGAREDVLAQLRNGFEQLRSAENPAAAVLEIVDGAGLTWRCGGRTLGGLFREVACLV